MWHPLNALLKKFVKVQPVQKNYLSGNSNSSDLPLPLSIPSSIIEELTELLKKPVISCVLILIALRRCRNMINLESRFLAVSKDYCA